MKRSNVSIHPTAVIDEPCVIGEGTKIWHFSHVMAGAKIGWNCTLGQNVYVAGQAVIGNNVKLQNNVSVYDLVTLEDDVFCGPSMVFTNDPLPRAKYPDRKRWEPTLVRQGATIGANATIVCGVTIGRHAFIGAGAVIREDIPDYAVVVGVPGRQVGWMCECGGKLTFAEDRATCGQCNRQFVQTDGIVQEVPRHGVH